MMFESKKEKQIKEYKELELENLHFDYAINHIKDLFNDISNKTNFNKYGYVTFEDLNYLTPNGKVDLLAIKAPKGTYVDIINPKEPEGGYPTPERSKLCLIITMESTGPMSTWCCPA